MGFTEKQETLVKESLKKVINQNIPEHGLRFFTLILEKAPAVKNMFPFLKDSDEIPQNNPKLNNHARIVFKLTCDSAIQLREKGQVVLPDVLRKRLRSVHLEKGVDDSHFVVMKEALLGTIKEAVGEHWSDEMGGAWGEAYDQLAATIKTLMQEEAAQPQLSTQMEEEAAQPQLSSN